MNKSVKIFQTPFIMAEKMSGILTGMISSVKQTGSAFNIALSGGNTPGLFFSVLADHFGSSADWSPVHFFWVDERCVPPGHQESNFRLARDILFERIRISPSNIHRIHGEDNPEAEAKRYSEEILLFTEKRDGLPVFNVVILGLGEDGHTASIFPKNIGLFNSGKICEAVVHPGSGQGRVTITGPVINNADSIFFMVTGKAKAGIVSEILQAGEPDKKYPASFVRPAYGSLSWLIDREAASLLTI